MLKQYNVPVAPRMPSPYNLLLATIPKSGTNLLRVSLFNYLCHINGDLREKTCDHMVQAFPNNFNSYLEKRARAAEDTLLPPGCLDFIYGHKVGPLKRRRLPFVGPVVLVARNPLDYIVSSKFYFFLNRGIEIDNAGVIRSRLPPFIAKYLKMLSLVDEEHALLLSYEDLFENPSKTLAKVAEHYGLPVDHGLLELAAKHGSIRAAREFENKYGQMHIGTERKRETVSVSRSVPFVCDGRIGQ